MKKLSCLFVLLAVTFLFFTLNSRGQQKSRSSSNDREFQLVAAQYEDASGNVHPVVYRIDTRTGRTHRLDYHFERVRENTVRFPYFGEVYDDEIKMVNALAAMKNALK